MKVNVKSLNNPVKLDKRKLKIYWNKTMSSPIQNVSDTALWVGAYRAKETERSDALFRDPFARQLVGDRGFEIAQSMPNKEILSTFIAVRTRMIDDYIYELIRGGVDLVLNLGAGLDSRPYRMELPSQLAWIEVDYPAMIERKEKILAGEKPRCALERIKLDLADREARKRSFADLNARYKKVFVLTEGVVPYLTNEQAAGLAEDLAAMDHFQFWMLDYLTAAAAKRVRRQAFHRKLKNAPFQFDPKDWVEFFNQQGWQIHTILYTAEEALRLGRPLYLPLWAKLFMIFMSAERRKQFARQAGYAVLSKRVTKGVT
jgi:methyltransferase (TIGR00027 family)